VLSYLLDNAVLLARILHIRIPVRRIVAGMQRIPRRAQIRARAWIIAMFAEAVTDSDSRNDLVWARPIPPIRPARRRWSRATGSPIASTITENIAKATTTLRLEDFEYRALVVQSGWQTPAEDYLIHRFKPIWNSEVRIHNAAANP
jgi:hypothetical protein